MKKIAILVAVAALLILPAAALAGVSGSDHDLTGSGEKLCFACHIPHNALGTKLWAQTPSGTFSGVQDLCYTCHDGTPTSVGLTTAFNASKQQHKNLGAVDCSGDGACHDVHNQNPNGSGKFAVVTKTNNSYCETCHDATPYAGAEGLGNHTAGLTHYTNGTTFTCNQCHTLHGATAQTTNPAGLTNPILLADNKPSYYGAFCISCHNGTAPGVAVSGTGGIAASDVFNYSDNTTDHSGWKHPSITTTTTNPVGGCDKCHDVHDPAASPAPKYLLKADNTNSAYCTSCHSAAGAPGVGANTHYTGIPSNVNMNSGLSPALPWANQINEDGVAGADWPTATANRMVCETCHSVHRNGYQTTPAYALRNDNSNNQICRACHTAN